jgi:hypothetical protein
MFTDPGEFHNFELLSRKEQRAFLRDRLMTQQAVGTAEPDDGEIDMDVGTAEPPQEKEKEPIKPKDSPGPLVSYETETEHKPHELDIGIAPGKGKRRKDSK